MKSSGIIVDESQLPKLIHEETDARAGRAYDGSQGLLADLRDYVLRRPLFPEIREQEEGATEPAGDHPGQPASSGVRRVPHVAPVGYVRGRPSTG